MTDQHITIPDGWKEATLGDMAVINPTESLRKGVIAKCVAMEKLDTFTRKISKYEVKEFNGGMKFRNGDTLLARITPCLENGKTAYVDFLGDGEIGFGSTEYIVIREKDGMSDKKFLYYLSVSPRFREIAIKAMTGTSGRQRVQTDLLVNKNQFFPPFAEQKTIAAVLSSFDDKIELLRTQNKTLENIAQTLFKHWFVDFEFPNKDGKPYKSSGGKMVDSELGEIPEGWQIKTIEEITLKVTKGTTPTTIGGKFSVRGINFIKAESITDHCSFESSKFSHIDFETNKLLIRSVIEEGDLLYSIAGTIGRYAIVPNYILPGNTNQAVAIIRADTKITDPFYLQCIFSLPTVKESLFGNIVEAVQANLSLSSIKNCKIILPDKIGVNLFVTKIRVLFDKITQNNLQIQTLSKIRDTILPKLMKGEIRVNNL